MTTQKSPKAAVPFAYTTLRCQKSRQMFGIRFEEAEGVWIATWQFRLTEGSEAREMGKSSVITGSIGLGLSYRGCPWCQSPSFFGCGCGKLSCWDQVSASTTCAWCQRPGNMTKSERMTSVKTGGALA